jgi:hypothetical protein
MNMHCSEDPLSMANLAGQITEVIKISRAINPKVSHQTD